MWFNCRIAVEPSLQVRTPRKTAPQLCFSHPSPLPVKANLIQAKAAEVNHKSGKLTIPAEHLTSMLLGRLLTDVDRYEKANAPGQVQVGGWVDGGDFVIGTWRSHKPGQPTRRAVLSVPPGMSLVAVKVR
jgi:hypothetical protein